MKKAVGAGGESVTVLLWIVVVVLLVLGFAGLVVPVLPDALLLLVAFLVYHFFINGDVLSASFWWTAAILTVVVIAVDYVASGLGAQKYGASKWSVASAALGVVIFPLILGPIGLIVGPFLAVVVTELLLRKTLVDSLKIGLGTIAGFLGGIFVKGLIMCALVVWFLWRALG